MSTSGEFAAGQMVGSYRIEAVLGVGGMGYVYRASGPDGEVALKLVKRDMAADETFRRRFDREARIAQQISHPHLVPVLDVGEFDGLPYLTQQLVRGGTLLDRLQRDGVLQVDEMADICVQVGGALDAIHANGLIHRDVKPANILLDEQGLAYITDFGLAKDTQGSLLTRPGQALGSLDYMAPEQIRGEDVSAATDVYAMGCVCYECLTGMPPFGDRQGMRVLWAQLQDDPTDPREKRPDLPAAAVAVILSALAKESAQRPQSLGEFAEQLKAAANA